MLVGKTCSGKSTVADILESEYHIPRVRTYTTRPPREDEDNEYHFVSVEEFEKLKTEGFFFETTQYDVASGETWHYGTGKEDLKDNACIVMNPDGMKKIRKLLSDEDFTVIIVYLNVTEAIEWNRLRKRGGESSADEATRRVQEDAKDFANIDEYYDYAITTDNLKPEELARKIVGIV